MSETFQADKVLDCSGMLCPVPVVKTSKAIKQIEVGQVLKMIATDPGAPPDMVAWAKNTRHELLDSHQEGDKFIFFLRRVR
ncbi:MAG: sulfurtransferase TusA family protein [Anaerolineales bacterium]|nr:sulfurtransferase TusA family protein [Anaerolineales bacterium]MCB9431559.1 sulfurtransferase TusA family protein [Ardenticatenaceae bacterium]